jgi:hypothetical protein
MINAKSILQAMFIVLIAGLLILGGCASPQIMPFPEGHPADPGLPEPTVVRSMTLADPAPVDTAPARSEHFDHNGHDQHDQDPNDHDHNDNDMHEDAQPEHHENEHHHHEMHH